MNPIYRINNNSYSTKTLEKDKIYKLFLPVLKAFIIVRSMKLTNKDTAAILIFVMIGIILMVWAARNRHSHHHGHIHTSSCCHDHDHEDAA